jgi:hypothetical protein
LEAYALSNAEEKTKDQQTYYMKGIPIHAYLSENGEFRWVPTSCDDEEKARMTLGVLKKMPDDRRDVWGSRLDREDTIARCPVIKNEPELSKEFDEFFAAYDKNRRKPKQIAEPRDGGESIK